MAELTPGTDLRAAVRERYAAAARAVAEPAPSASCCGPVATADAAGSEVFGAALYDGEEAGAAPAAALGARWAAACRPRWPTCTRARPCSTSGPGRARTC